jgi:hypothetical protein
MNALRHNIKRIFFGGFFIRGHPYTMDTISFAIRFWSKVRRSPSAGEITLCGGTTKEETKCSDCMQHFDK